jgi:monooxygenase
MLQRTPTYIASQPLVDPIVTKMNDLLPAKVAATAARWKAIAYHVVTYQLARNFPKYFARGLRAMAEHRLPKDFDFDKHFAPSYKPWDQRLCVAPNGDLFKAIRRGNAEVVTDTIERFTEKGIKLTSGAELDADIIVTATGLNVRLFGGAEVLRNGEPVDLTNEMAYKGMMLTGMPNMVFTIGYTNASWTLKADLVSEFFCRVLNYMDEHGYDTVVPEHPGSSVEERPLMELRPATCCVRSTSCPSRVRRRRGG